MCAITMRSAEVERVANGPVSYLGRGVYDLAEVAHLIHRTTRQVASWMRPRSGIPLLLAGELNGLYSFWDMLSLRVIAELVDRGVPRGRDRRGRSSSSPKPRHQPSVRP